MFKRLAKQVINRTFRFMPNEFVYARHRFANRGGMLTWRNAPYYFIHVPKTGGQSLVRAIGRQYAGHYRYCDLPTALRASLANRPHVSIIRDPVGRLLSAFKYAHQLEEQFQTTTLSSMTEHREFSRYVRDRFTRENLDTHYFLRPAWRFLEGAPIAHLWLVSFDHLETGILRFLEIAGQPPIELKHHNRTQEVRELDLTVDEQSRSIIRQRYRRDVEICDHLGDQPLKPAKDLFETPSLRYPVK